MNIEEALKLLEEDYVEQDIKALAPKDRLNFWQNLKEFTRAKIQRVNFEPLTDKDKRIKIVYGDE